MGGNSGYTDLWVCSCCVVVGVDAEVWKGGEPSALRPEASGAKHMASRCYNSANATPSKCDNVLCGISGYTLFDT